MRSPRPPGALTPPPAANFPRDHLPVPDRWRLVETLGLTKSDWRDPYNQNTYKGDRPINRAKVPWLPIKGDDWFFVANLISDSVYEPRTFPIPVGVQSCPFAAAPKAPVMRHERSVHRCDGTPAEGTRRVARR